MTYANFIIEQAAKQKHLKRYHEFLEEFCKKNARDIGQANLKPARAIYYAKECWKEIYGEIPDESC